MKYVVRLVAKHDNSRHTRVGMYAARSGSQHSYTARLEDARVFSTREAAEAECCENERVIDVDDLVGTGGGS